LVFGSGTGLADVTFASGLDLNGATRSIQVVDNPTTGMDFVTVSGVISNSGAAGAGVNINGTAVTTAVAPLYLYGANTYDGPTNLLSGSMFVKSLGSAGATASNLGTNVGGGPLNLGSGGNGSALFYVGPGETVTRRRGPFWWMRAGRVRWF
jgi:hypothetical protein